MDVLPTMQEAKHVSPFIEYALTAATEVGGNTHDFRESCESHSTFSLVARKRQVGDVLNGAGAE